MSLISNSNVLKSALRIPGNRTSKFSTLANRFYNDEQKALHKTTVKLIESEINPYADQVKFLGMFFFIKRIFRVLLSTTSG
jgi:hypothetical protein